jgi:hypothetical protein
MKLKLSECQLARRFWRGHFRSDSAKLCKRNGQNGGQKKKDAGGPCQIRVAPGLGFLGQAQSGVRSCSLVGSWVITPAQQCGYGWSSSWTISQPLRSSSTGSPAPVALRKHPLISPFEHKHTHTDSVVNLYRELVENL